MTFSEKVKQLGSDTPGVARLGIPPYNWWSEGLHGVSSIGGGSHFDQSKGVPAATSFPTPITSTATFNESLWKKIGQAISNEARAMHNLGIAGLTFWTPTINVVRDPRWGRTMETPGEDPLVVGRYAVNHVRGLQDVEGHETTIDPGSRPLKVSACCKHYATYDLDNWATFGNLVSNRYSFNANVTERDMMETFLRPFEMCIKEGQASGVMCTHSKINDIPVCADARLLSQTLRKEWNFHGYIVTDCDSLEVMFNDQKFLDDMPEDAVAQALQAGVDLNCGSTYPNILGSAMAKGLIRENDVDKALINNYMVLMRVGWFDGHPMYDSLGAHDVCSKEHMELAADAARQGIVLLKNNILPLSQVKFKKLAVVGPHAHALDDMIGSYAGKPCHFVSPILGLSKYATVDYKKGCANVLCKHETFIFPAVKAARDADATIIVAGLSGAVENQNLDRTDLELPGYQNMLIRQVSSAAKGPVILVVLSAGGVNLEPVEKDVDAIIWAGYPGEEGGQAIADVVFGKYNPGGRLPVTWYKSDYVWQLPMTSMQLRPVDELGYPGRTYKFFNGSTLYPFGYGLSYTNFSYKVVSTQKSVEKKLAFNQHCLSIHYKESAYVPPCSAALVENLNCNEDITVVIEVINTGSFDGSDVVMLYSRLPEGIVGAPIMQLIGFQRTFVQAGKSEIVSFKLSSCKSLSMVTDSAYMVLPAGQHTMTVGSGPNAVTFPFQVNLAKFRK